MLCHAHRWCHIYKHKHISTHAPVIYGNACVWMQTQVQVWECKLTHSRMWITQNFTCPRDQWLMYVSRYIVTYLMLWRKLQTNCHWQRGGSRGETSMTKVSYIVAMSNSYLMMEHAVRICLDVDFEDTQIGMRWAGEFRSSTNKTSGQVLSSHLLFHQTGEWCCPSV